MGAAGVLRMLVAGAVCAALGACASTKPPAVGKSAAATSPKAGPKIPKGQYRASSAPKLRRISYPTPSSGAYKVGAPYQAGGLWYVPAEQPDYVETGIASWYGDAFDGKPTANGEIFDMRIASAAHTTLPMPSLVEVTNLDNGRTLKVRLNDRGPFKPGRIIDLSRAAAEELGFRAQGTASVRVRYLGPAELQIARAPVTRSTLTPAPVIDRSAEGGWAVQAGAFSEPDRADRVAASLKSAGRTTIAPLERDGRKLYRVLVGPWSAEGDALAARSRVASLGFAEARVVQAF